MASIVQAVPHFKTIRGTLHIVDKMKITNQKKLMAKTRATEWFQKRQKSDKLCPYSWKVTSPVHNRLPRCIIKAECKKCNKLLCNPLFNHMSVRYTNKHNGEHTWQTIPIPVAFVYKL